MSQGDWEAWAEQMDAKLALVGEGDRVIVVLKGTAAESDVLDAVVEELRRIGLEDRSTVFVSPGDGMEVNVVRGAM